MIQSLAVLSVNNSPELICFLASIQLSFYRVKNKEFCSDLKSPSDFLLLMISQILRDKNISFLAVSIQICKDNCTSLFLFDHMITTQITSASVCSTSNFDQILKLWN